MTKIIVSSPSLTQPLLLYPGLGPAMLDNIGGVSFDKKGHNSQHIFRFEKWWLEMPDFTKVVEKAWDLKCPSSDPVQIWQCKIRNLRSKIRGWNRNRKAEIRKSKVCHLRESDALDLDVGSRPLSVVEIDRKKDKFRA
jgi:hypothetical protein